MPRLNPRFEQYVKGVMSGKQRGFRAASLRAVLSAAEILYALISRLRNTMFDSGLRKRKRLGRPVISIGNLTTGGTGKTPVARWLAEHLRDAGYSVAILSRGYKARPGETGDEQRMLGDLLNTPGSTPVFLQADPSRLKAGNEALRAHPNIGVFLLDDGFQHRQLARDFDLVLLDAAEPFGFKHVLPRGMLREPLAAALQRANAFLVTRSDHADHLARERIAETIRKRNPEAPIYETVHAATGFRGSADARPIPLEALATKKWFAFCGIGNPDSFLRQLETFGGVRAGSRFFADHHPYAPEDIAAVARESTAAGAELLVTTEKDWVKIAAWASPLPIWRLDVAIRFLRAGDDARLLADITRAIESARVR